MGYYHPKKAWVIGYQRGMGYTQNFLHSDLGNEKSYGVSESMGY